MIKILLNQLRLECMEKLDLKEKIKLVKKLRAKPYNLSYNDITKKTGLPKTTMHRWMTQPLGQLEYQTFNVDRLIKYFDGYKPKLIEFKKIEKLIIILEKVIEV